MQNRDNGLMAVVVIPCLIVLALLLWLSRSIGASFASACTTATSLIFLGGVLGAVWYFLKDFSLQLVATFFAIGWFTTWPVLTSIANGGDDSDTSFRPWHQGSFIDSAWMTRGVELIFVALLCLAVFHEYRRRLYW
jgi:hypothetical protein